METKRKILVVDDEPALCDTLKFNLEMEGYEADTALSAEEALALPLEDYSLILLDIMMDGISGTDFARILKRNPAISHIPIIFCTARDAEDDMVGGLELGADDYITKPYSIRNVMSRVRAVLRRVADKSYKARGEEEAVRSEGLTLDCVAKTCTVDGTEVHLPRKEFEMLRLFLSKPGRIFTREEIISAVWPEEIVVLNRVVDVNVRRLRSKLGEYGKRIITRSGYGYGYRG
ncbi:MAG: response regulator transcription factor [Muribaculaceae bacterium]|nr:response regulator transcription factor [Muribaculaceae bacterium]